MRPGVDVISRAQPLPRTASTDVGQAFMIGATGTTKAYQAVRSLTEYVAVFGDRAVAGNQASYDAADAYFREGGALLHVSSTTGTVALAWPDDPSTLSRAELEAKAAELGIDTTTLSTKADVIDAVEERLGTDPQVVGTGVQTALDRLGASLGPGQVFFADIALGAQIDNVTAQLLHCSTANRVALLSVADGTAAAMAAAAATIRALATARYGAIFGPQAIIPGIVAGTTRTVPYAAIQAGMIARSAAVYNANVPVAGDNGQAAFSTDLTTKFTDAEYATLNLAGVNMAKLVYNGVRTYGYRPPVDTTTAAGVWLNFGNARLNMQIVAQAFGIGEHYVFSQIDGRWRTLSSFGSDLRAMLVPLYEGGALYGASAEDAFDVNVGPAVNTPTTIANGEIHAVIQARMSQFAEWVVIEIVKVATNQAI